MRKESWSIGIACFIGTALGLLIAWKLAEMFSVGRYLWFTGAFLGAIAAYLLYDPISVWNAAKRAWHELTDKEHAKRLLSEALFTGETILLVSVIVAGIAFTFFGGFIGFKLNLWGKELEILWLISSLVALFLSCFGYLFFLLNSDGGGEKSKSYPSFFRKEVRLAALFLNPIVLPVVLAAGSLFFFWEVARGIAWLVIWHIPEAVGNLGIFSGRFVRRVFILIHSSERTICFVDTALGVAVSYTLVSPTLTGIFLGGAIGLALGVMNYELISVRVLKLIPARVR